MFDKIIPVIIALIALQFIIRVIQKRKYRVTRSEWRDIDYKKRIDILMKGGRPDGEIHESKGITIIGIDDYSSIPDEMRGVRKEVNHIRDALSAGLRAKIGRDESESIYNEPEKMFDEIIEVINRHKKVAAEKEKGLTE